MSGNRFFILLAVLAGPAPAQPVISYDGVWGVENAASYAAKGLPNAPIAQGSIFAIFGTGLGPTPGAQVSSYPLTDTFNGVSISVSQGSVTVAAIPLYVSATQINAIMPSNAPLGSDTVAVTFQGETSIGTCAQCPLPTVQVVPASFGILAINQAGSGQGVITNGQNQAISYTASATPGEVLNIWGTGLGAIQGSDQQPPPAGDIGAVPTVYVGGVEVAALYHGRSPCCSGLDQIQFQVPAAIAGCNIPVAVQAGGVVSNFVSIAIAPGGGVCSDPNGISGSDLTTFAAQGAVSTGHVSLSDNVGYASFARYPYANFSLTYLPLQILNFGACAVYSFSTLESAAPLPLATPILSAFPGVGLDAGSSLSVNGPNGELQIPAMSAGTYQAFFGTSDLPPGPYAISGMGGKDVGPFTVSVQMPAPLTWTNPSSLETITRADGLTVNWTGVDPTSYLIVSGYSLSATGYGAGFNCTVQPSAGQFTVPSIVLLALPPSAVLYDDGETRSEAGLQVGSAEPPVNFGAAGLGFAQAISSASVSQIVTYQ